MHTYLDICIHTYTLGCIERLCKKIKIGILIWPSNRQVPFDMGSRKVQQFLKIFNVLRCPQRAKVSEKLIIFIKWPFSSLNFLYLTNSKPYHIPLERAVKTKKNGI